MLNDLIKILFCAFCLLALGHQAQAQSSLTAEGSLNITNFHFMDSIGTVDTKYQPNISGAFAFGYRYTLDFGLFFGLRAGLRNAGATYIYDEENYSWEMLYLDTRLGLGYEKMFGKFGIQVGVDGFFGYLLKANQRLNNENYDIKSSGALSSLDGGLVFSLGGKFKASDVTSVFLNVNYLMGLMNIETDNAQTTNNRMYGATLGLQFNIK